MSNVRTATAVGGGAAFGNGIAYFALWYLGYKYKIEFGDPELALAMGGAVVASLLLYVTKAFTALGKGVAYIFNRIWPEKKNVSDTDSNSKNDP